MKLRTLMPFLSLSVLGAWGCEHEITAPGDAGAPYEIVFGRYGDFFVTSLDGSAQRSLGFGGGGQWSPRGDKIAFFGWIEEPGFFLCTIKPDSSDFRSIALATREGETLTVSLDWSPDGEKLVFFTTKYHSSGFAVINVDGTDERNLTPEGYWRDVDWSPDGSRIALEGAPSRDPFPGIYIVNANGTNFHRLVESRAVLPFWSQHGRRIAFSIPAREEYSPDIYMANVDGTNIQRITSDENTAILDWSPDGGRFLYGYVPAGADYLSTQSIGLMNVDGSGRETLLEGDATVLYNFAKFSPDASKIAYVRLDRGGAEDPSSLWVMDADGTNKRKLYGFERPGLIFYDWRPISK